MQKLLKYVLIFAMCFTTSIALAQVDVQGKETKGMDTKDTKQEEQLRADSIAVLPETIEMDRPSMILNRKDRDSEELQLKLFTNAAAQSLNDAPSLHLWKGAFVGASGSIVSMPGMMDVESGSVSLYQELNKNLSFEVSGLANKYWMPGQFSLQKQFGVGGSVNYRVNSHISLHAYGNYYGRNPMMGPAMFPYMNTNSYGGFANVQFSSRFRTEVGVHRYFSPLTGRWETDPIIRPYIKVGKSKTEIGGIDFGYLLKALIIGSRERQMQPQMMVPNPAATPAPAPSGVHRLK